MRHASSPGPKAPRRALWAFVLILGLVLVLVVLRPWGHGDNHDHSAHGKVAESTEESSRKKGREVLRAGAAAPLREGDPEGQFHHLFDRQGNKFLLSRTGPKNLIPDSDAPAGMDLWLRSADGTERLVAEGVYRAKFSPDGTKIAYTTENAELHVEGIAGDKLHTVAHSYDPSWSPDSSKVAFAKAQDGSHVVFPETLQITVLDVGTGDFKAVTDGSSDDVRPHFSPENPDCIIFVNGGRSGLASFWKVCGDGPPEQLTNRGMQGVNDLFVPTPYKTSFFERGWFVYDFKNGEQQETWAVRIGADGQAQHRKIGQGIEPRFGSDGKLTTVRYEGERAHVLTHAFP